MSLLQKVGTVTKKSLLFITIVNRPPIKLKNIYKGANHIKKHPISRIECLQYLCISTMQKMTLKYVKKMALNWALFTPSLETDVCRQSCSHLKHIYCVAKIKLHVEYGRGWSVSSPSIQVKPVAWNAFIKYQWGGNPFPLLKKKKNHFKRVSGVSVCFFF